MPRESDTGSPTRRRLPDFSRPEVRSAALLALYNFLVMCSFAVIKPARNALLLERLGPSYLPVGFIGAAVTTGVVVYAAGWLVDRVPERNRVSATMLGLTLNLLLFRWLFDVLGDGVALAFYIWAQLFSSILFTQLWLVAGDLLTPREAKRVLGWLGAGGTVGAIVGPWAAFHFVGLLGTENLIYISAALLVPCLPLVRHLEGREKSDASAPAVDAEPDSAAPAPTRLGLFREFRHLKLIALISGVGLVVQTVVDYQFQAIAAEAFHTENAKTAFFAQFFAVQNLVGLALQLLLTRFVLLRFGVGVALSLLPIALVMGSAGILLYPILWVAVLAKLGEGSVRYSFQEATREILWLPLPSSVRSRARPLIEIFGARLFEGLGGLLILVCTSVFAVSVGRLSLVSIGLIAVWGGAVLAVKREYLEALRDRFAEIPAQSQDRAAEVLDPDTVEMLARSLEEPDEVRVCQALAMLDLVHDKSALVGPLKRTMAHPSLSVRAGALRLLRSAGEGGLIGEAEALLSARDADVRVEAVRYLCRFGDASKAAAFLKDADLRIRTAAIAAVAGAKTQEKGEVRAALEQICHHGGADGEEVRAEAALVLGTVDDPEYDDLMVHLLKDPSPVVVRAALEGVERTPRRVLVPVVVPHLADERVMLYAQRALRAYGDRVLGTLRDYLDDPGEPEALRRAIPGCFAAIGTPGAAAALTDILEDHQERLGDAIVEALGEVRSRRPDISFDAGRVEAALRREVDGPPGPAFRRPEAAQRLRLVMGLLALIYPPEDIYRAHAGLTSGRRDLKANALELLDNLLRPELKRGILPHIEVWTPSDAEL